MVAEASTAGGLKAGYSDSTTRHGQKEARGSSAWHRSAAAQTSAAVEVR
jgi:hypothetical protein